MYLFATLTCPNCKIACASLDKAGIEYSKVYADNEPEKAQQFGIKQAPTLVITDGNGGFVKYAGAPAIKEYLATLA